MVNIDKDLIKRAISNLIQNSINHNTDGCEIYILVKVEDNCHIIVSDNGIMEIGHSKYGGFEVGIMLPIEEI